MGNSVRRRGGRKKAISASCGTSKLSPSKMLPSSSMGEPRWNALPEGPLIRMFEVMAAQNDGRDRLREAKLVCRTWRTSVRDVVLGDTATSRPCRPPLQANSEQAKPAATMNTCGAMMCGSNQSKDAVNDELEVCSKPAQLAGSSSGNMYGIAEEAEDAEQAGSAEQPRAAPPKRRRTQKAVRGSSLQAMSPQTGGAFQVTRHMTRAAAAAAAAAAVQAASLAAADTAGLDAGTAHAVHHDMVDAAAGPSKEADSDSEGAEPSSNGTGPQSFVRHQDQQSPEAETSEEVQGARQGQAEAECHPGPSAASSGQQTPEQHAAPLDAIGSMSQAPGWRRLEARMEGVLPIWSILKRFGRRAQTET